MTGHRDPVRLADCPISRGDRRDDRRIRDLHEIQSNLTEMCSLGDTHYQHKQRSCHRRHRCRLRSSGIVWLCSEENYLRTKSDANRTGDIRAKGKWDEGKGAAKSIPKKTYRD